MMGYNYTIINYTKIPIVSIQTHVKIPIVNTQQLQQEYKLFDRSLAHVLNSHFTTPKTLKPYTFKLSTPKPPT